MKFLRQQMKESNRISIALAIILLFFNLTYAQKKATISGRVFNAETKEAIVDANVYIANSSLGSSTDKYGRYKIIGVEKGSYQLVVSSVGYKKIVRKILINSARDYRYTFNLEPKIYELPTVIINEEEKQLWQERLETFIKQFIGQSSNAEKCILKNPFVLEFEEENNALVAKASQPLIIINNALGYEIKYFLDYFMYHPPNTLYKGIPVFKPLEAPDEETKAEWEEARLKTYCGSLRHFLSAASKDYDEKLHISYDNNPMNNDEYKGVLERQGFSVYHIKFIRTYKNQLIYSKITTPEYISTAENGFEKIISFEEALEIIYNRKEEDPKYLDFIYQNRWPEKPVAHIYLHDDKVKFDSKGRYFDEFKIQTLDYWAFYRLADMLPFEYEVSDSVLENINFIK